MDTRIQAKDVQPGMRFRALGSGYMSREVVEVVEICNHEASARVIDRETGEAAHFPVVVIKAQGYSSICKPEAEVVVTDSEW